MPRLDGSEAVGLVPSRYSCEMYTEYHAKSAEELFDDELIKAVIVPEGVSLKEFCEANYPGRYELPSSPALRVYKHRFSNGMPLDLLEQELGIHGQVLLDSDGVDMLCTDLADRGYGKMHSSTSRVEAFCNGLVMERHAGPFRYSHSTWKVTMDPVRAQKLLNKRARAVNSEPKPRAPQLTVCNISRVGYALREFLFKSLHLDDITHVVWAGQHWRTFYATSWDSAIHSMGTMLRFLGKNKRHLPWNRLKINGGLDLIPLIKKKIVQLNKKSEEYIADYVRILTKLCKFLNKYGTKAKKNHKE